MFNDELVVIDNLGIKKEDTDDFSLVTYCQFERD